MGLSVRFDQRALADLHEIRHYLLPRSPPALNAFVCTLQRPSIAWPILLCSAGQLTSPLVRVLPLTRYPYLIFYAVLESEVVILHVRHGARQPIDPSRL